MSVVRKVKYYGLHQDDNGVYHLMQEGGSGNFIGLPPPLPFYVAPEVSRPCPHLMNISGSLIAKSHWKFLKKLLLDDLVCEMLPLPKERGSKILYFNDPSQRLLMILVTLSRLSSPIDRIVHQYTNITPKKLLAELAITNVAPLVLTGLKPEHQYSIQRLVQESVLLPRRLVLLGDPTVVATGLIKRKETSLLPSMDEDLAVLPMENLGEAVLRQYARGEKIGRH